MVLLVPLPALPAGRDWGGGGGGGGGISTLRDLKIIYAGNFISLARKEQRQEDGKATVALDFRQLEKLRKQFSNISLQKKTRLFDLSIKSMLCAEKSQGNMEQGQDFHRE